MTNTGRLYGKLQSVGVLTGRLQTKGTLTATIRAASQYEGGFADSDDILALFENEEGVNLDGSR